MREKIRPNVIILAVFLTALAILMVRGMFRFLGEFIPDGDFWDGAVIGSVFTLCISVVSMAIGGLVATMSGVSQDPPPPTIPAEVHQKIVEALINDDDRTTHAS